MTKKHDDLTDLKFNEWTVIKYLGKSRWQCKCSCGKISIVSSHDLKNNKSKSCGHDRQSKTLIDLTNKYFGDWHVLRYIGDHYWECECSCGRIKHMRSDILRSGKSTGCGHQINIKGQKFGDWEVIRNIGADMWECKCSCGKVKILRGNWLRNGDTKSCGHNTNAFKDLTNQQFGELTVLEYLNNGYWKCKCSCGKEVIKNGAMLKKSDTIASCGHLRRIDLKGRKVGILTVEEYIGNGFWRCICDCGNIKLARANNLIDESVKSCGCLSRKKVTFEELLSAIHELEYDNNDKPYIDELADKLDVHKETIRRYVGEYNLESYINKSFRSVYERDIAKLIPDAKYNVRGVVDNYELDIYIPEKKIAIEFNGDYWHSEQQKGKYYHQQKTMDCAKQGIRLIHIFEYEWLDDNKRDKIVKLITNIANNEDKTVIMARNTYVKEIDNIKAKDFLEKYHLQGAIDSLINIGIFFNNEMMGIMSFSKPRFNTEYQYELTRLCWKNDTIVVGGLEKLFSYFLNNFNPESIITYCDISKFRGDSYTRLGFKLIQPKPITEPNYVWVDSYTHAYLTRYQTQRHKIAKSDDIGLTESDIMCKRGFLRVYDSGNLRLEWNKEWKSW